MPGIPYGVGTKPSSAVGVANPPPNDFYGAYTAVTIPANGYYWFTPGTWLVFPAPDTGGGSPRIEVNTSGTTYTTFITLSTTTGAMIQAPDGGSVRLMNYNANAQTYHIMQLK